LCGSKGGVASLAAELEERRREFVLSRLERQAGDFSPTSPEFGLPLPEQIAEVLADEIIEREVAPGSRLPEPALAERFGTSRAPIREALYLLDQAGLVERTPRRGTVVKAYSRREIEELYQVRITLERLALERICEDPDMVDACLATLEPIMREMEAAQDDPMRYRELNYLFHRSIIVVSRSDLIRRLYAQIEGPLKIFLRRMFFPKGAARKSFGEHLQILAAIEEADVKKAQQRLEKHDLDGMKRAIASSLPDQPAAGRQ
jgi:DNA-binding GntR family transcriptional regulator